MTTPHAPQGEGHATRGYTVDELKLAIDQRLQMETPADPVPIPVRLLGYLKGRTLIIKLPAGSASGTAAVSEGDEVVVRGFSGRIAFAFSSIVEKIRYLPYAYCHLQFPDSIQGAEIRKAMRVRLEIPARVVNPERNGEQVLEASISNLSVAGAMLVSSTPLGMVGDHISLSFHFRLPDNDYEVDMEAKAVIQTAEQDRQENAPGMQYGIGFKNMRSSESILLQNLICYQLQENPQLRI